MWREDGLQTFVTNVKRWGARSVVQDENLSKFVRTANFPRADTSTTLG